MATEFGFEATSVSDIPSAQTPKEGVVQQPVLLQGLTNIFEQANDLLKTNKLNKSQQFLADFTSRQLLVADAYEQGKIRSASHAQSLMRKNLLDAIDLNPALVGDLIEAQKSITGLPGGAKIVDERTDEENRNKDLVDKLTADGFLDANATQAEQQFAIDNYQLAQEAARVHQARTQTLDLKLKTLELGSKERAAVEAEKKELDRKTANTFAPLELGRMRNHLQTILDGEGTPADKITLIEDFYTQWKSQATSAFSGLDSTEFSAMLAPFEMTLDQYKKRASGEISLSTLNTQNDMAAAIQTNLALQDPNISRLVVASKLFGDNGFLRAIADPNNKALNSFLKFMQGSTPGKENPANPFSSLMEDKQGLKQWGETLNGAALSSDPEIAAEAQERIANLLDSTEDFEGKIRKDPKASLEYVDWLASPGFLKAVQTNPDLLGHTSVAKDIIGRHYSNEVWGLVQREFAKNKIVNPQTYFSDSDFAPPSKNVTIDTKDVVGYRSTDSGMEFYALSNDPLAVDKARSLNKELKPIITKTIKAMSHLEGKANYKQMWESVAKDFLDGDGIIDNDPEDNLVIKDFQQSLEDLESSGAPVGDIYEAGPGYTVVKLEDGTLERRSGTRAWRNNNPGNIEYGSFAKSQGAIGSDGRFAVFKTYEEGRNAKESLLFESKSYSNKTIQTAIEKYAPSFENDTNAYAKTIARAAGVLVDTPLSELSPEQRKKLLDAMEQVEGFKKGKTEIITP